MFFSTLPCLPIVTILLSCFHCHCHHINHRHLTIKCHNLYHHCIFTATPVVLLLPLMPSLSIFVLIIIVDSNYYTPPWLHLSYSLTTLLMLSAITYADYCWYHYCSSQCTSTSFPVIANAIEATTATIVSSMMNHLTTIKIVIVVIATPTISTINVTLTINITSMSYPLLVPPSPISLALTLPHYHEAYFQCATTISKITMSAHVPLPKLLPKPSPSFMLLALPKLLVSCLSSNVHIVTWSNFHSILKKIEALKRTETARKCEEYNFEWREQLLSP